MVLGRRVGDNGLSLDKTQTHYVNRVRRSVWRRIGGDIMKPETLHGIVTIVFVIIVVWVTVSTLLAAW